MDREKLEELAKQRMQQIAKKVKEELPEGFGFVVLAFEFDAAPNTAQMMYVSNANRDDVEKAINITKFLCLYPYVKVTLIKKGR